jgi:uncharacterized glyoxalase superfamily protein PhnB
MIQAMILALILTLVAAFGRPTAGEERISMKKLTPVLLVEEIEPSLPFWVHRLGFKKTVEVPEGQKLGFVSLAKDNVEIMYQSRASLEKDVPALAKGSFRSSTVLYIQVPSLDEILPRLEGVEVVVPVRKTFYGANEIGVREPAGNVIIFAAFEEKH